MTRTEHDLRTAFDSPVDSFALDRLTLLVGELSALDGSVERPRRRRPTKSWFAPLSAAAAVVLLVLGVVLATDHYGGSKPATGPTSIPSDIEPSALTLWAGFPVNASPRPLVLTGPAINDPSSGFPNGPDKIAYIVGNFDLGVALSAPAQTSGEQLATAASALEMLRGTRTGGPPTDARLTITDVHLGTSTFSTDRGQRTLPAWIFAFAGVADPASVLAVPAADRWPHAGTPPLTSNLNGATIVGSGHEVIVSFVGSPPGSGPCEAEYTADVGQSATAVAISVRKLPNPNSTPTTMCTQVGYQRMVTVTLTSALGNRVVVDSKGAPIPTK